MKSLMYRTAFVALIALVGALPAFAQSQFTENGLTREGTVITNVATASFTDANGNTYADVTAQASVTVGFLANLDIFSEGTQAPTGPSQNNQLALTITNNGNGEDFLALSVNIPEGITNVRYIVDGREFNDLASLNAALAGMSIEADGVLSITVLYDVEEGFGGSTLVLDVTATSVRAPEQTGGSDSTTILITPVRSDGVNVSPDGLAVDRLPSNGTQYTETFTLMNTGNATDTFNLLALLDPDAVLSIVSVNGAAGTSTSVTLNAGQSQTITVVYTVANDAPAGTTNTITLRATSVADPTKADDGTVNVTVIRSQLAMSKTAYQDDRLALIGSSLVLPGQYIQYLIAITNNGTANATQVEIVDALPAELIFDSVLGDASGWSFSQSGNTVTASLEGSLAPAASRSIWIRARVK